MSVFDTYRADSYPYRFNGKLHVPAIAGGTPTDPKVAEGWLRTKLGQSRDDMIRELVAQTMLDRNVTAEEATELVNINRNLNGFKKDDNGLFIDGRQLKACIKEATSVAVAADKLKARGWGKTNKGLLSFVAEHVFVTNDRLYLNATEPTRVDQRFVHTWRGSGIQYEEVVEDAQIEFNVISDYDFSEKEWAQIWLTAEQQGLGASRSQGYGRFEVVEWVKM